MIAPGMVLVAVEAWGIVAGDDDAARWSGAEVHGCGAGFDGGIENHAVLHPDADVAIVIAVPPAPGADQADGRLRRKRRLLADHDGVARAIDDVRDGDARLAKHDSLVAAGIEAHDGEVAGQPMRFV